MHIEKPQYFWENVHWTDETKLEPFANKSISSMFTEPKINQKNEPCTSDTLKKLSSSVLLHLTQSVLNLAGYNEISRLSKY